MASHASHRVASEKTLLAMPETGIGLLPDVGGTWILANAPGRFGEYLGLTGTRIGVADAILTGFTDSYVPSADLAALIATLEETGDVSAVAKAAKDPKTAVEPAVAPFLESIRAEIESIFDCTTPMAILEDLKASDSAWAQDAAKAIARACPLSVACTLIGVRDTRDMDSLEEALAHELRFTWRSQEIGELNEGVRAQLIDKDRDPKWKWPRLEDVWPDRAMAMFAPLGDNELKL